MTEEIKEALTEEGLAKEIVAALIDKKLLNENKKEKLINEIMGGKMNQDDWRLYVDIAQNERG